MLRERITVAVQIFAAFIRRDSEPNPAPIMLPDRGPEFYGMKVLVSPSEMTQVVKNTTY
jgi:hypothetical protein